MTTSLRSCQWERNTFLPLGACGTLRTPQILGGSEPGTPELPWQSASYPLQPTLFSFGLLPFALGPTLTPLPLLSLTPPFSLTSSSSHPGPPFSLRLHSSLPFPLLFFHSLFLSPIFSHHARTPLLHSEALLHFCLWPLQVFDMCTRGLYRMGSD